MIPAVGTRFRGGEGKFTWVLRYVGLNLDPMYESMDAYRVEVVETCAGGPPVGTRFSVEARWFKTHRQLDRHPPAGAS